MPRPARRMRASAGAQAIISWIGYVRVSTAGQGRSGLGLDAQKEAVARHIATAGGHLVAEFQEIESGKRSDRPVLTAALAACRARRAVLIVAKLDTQNPRISGVPPSPPACSAQRRTGSGEISRPGLNRPRGASGPSRDRAGAWRAGGTAPAQAPVRAPRRGARSRDVA